ncbi:MULTISPECIES: ABC transporter substrate-binding protein [unclassified Leptolyngbya]|uniref:ABC transporter substrate-binding protein n=1 Tax=unclassified Leptolyngbya TaxID=2650499 RepID=UPI0016885ECB|nr:MULTISPECIES: ABC transporter substrate-binding protein [unclassified Leptolyngbya]MBD1912573.1 ABC transporter substrate-binding protein [Leptolyngbya sp. FACHB-8]MBD2158483.1 ABC transporter substrate-binding protein [Leptolyngbya sp. FACHB-16]
MIIHRRHFLQLGAGVVLAIAAHGCTKPEAETSGANTTTAEDPGKITIGFWPVASGLPLFVAEKKGYFKDAALNVEVAKFASPNQVAEALIAGRLQGTGNGVASGVLGLSEITSPGLFKIIAANPSNVDYKLDQVIVAKNSSIQSIADLKDKKFATGPGAQNLAIAQAILTAAGVTNPQVQQLEIRQHVAAIEAGQIDAAYTLEPTGTVGELKGITRTLENGVVSKYILGDPKAPWFGGAAVLSTQFIQQYPETAKTYIEAYRRAVNDIKTNPDEVRQYLVGYTAIEGDLVEKVPMVDYRMYDEFTPEEVGQFQKFFDFMTEKKVFEKTVDVKGLLYAG